MRRLSGVAVLVALSGATALAEGLPLSLLGRHELICPVCRQVFTTVSCTQTNTRGGVDRDLFARALGPQPEYYRISTCPRCGYSGYLSDFDPEMTLPPDFVRRVLESPKLDLPEGITAESDPREIDASDKYRLAIRCYRWAGRSDEALAWLHLRASWIARDKGATLPEDPRLARVIKYIERYKPPLPADGNQAEVELQLATRVTELIDRGDFNRFQRPYVELAVVLILRRHGENRPIAGMLDRLAGYEDFSDALRAAIVRMRDSIAAERGHQSEAITCFERAILADQIEQANRGTACYLLGELNRRLGRKAEAIRWYTRAMREPITPEQVVDWAELQRSGLE